MREEAIIKATLKEKKTVTFDGAANQKDDGEDQDGWESVEEDYPHIKLDELKDLQTQLAGMKIQGADDDDDDDDDEDFDDEEEGVEAKKEEKKSKTKK